MYRDIIVEAIKRVIGVDEVKVEYPAEAKFGDYSTNVAMQMMSDLSSSKSFEGSLSLPARISAADKSGPRELAEGIIEELKQDSELGKIVEKIEIAGPGFINFYLNNDVLRNVLIQIDKQGEDFGKSEIGKGKTIIVDYSAPNIAKKFSLGHLRSTIIGQAIYNLYTFLGFDTVGDNHLGDWGTQFGMIIAAVVRANLNVSELSVDELEKLYIEYNEEIKENPGLRDEAKGWFKKLEEGDSQARAIWQGAVEVSLKEFGRIWDRLGIRIDYAHGESFYEDKMQAIVDEAAEKGLSRISEGATVIDLGNDIPPAMILKSDGTTTYLTRDLATIKYRHDTWNPQIIVYEVGSEQTLHFQQVFRAAAKFDWGQDIEFVHIGHGLILRDGKKMSTRLGTNVGMEEILDRAVEKARELSEDDNVARQVGIGAVKYFDLLHHPSSSYNFSWDEVLSLQGNSGPYLQYTYARTQSVLLKAKTRSLDFARDDNNVSFRPEQSGVEKSGEMINDEELALMRHFVRFPEIIVNAAENYSPNLLCNYLFDLAQKYNTFYNMHTILRQESGRAGEQEGVNILRLKISQATGQILQNGLHILGIETPERM